MNIEEAFRSLTPTCFIGPSPFYGVALYAQPADYAGNTVADRDWRVVPISSVVGFDNLERKTNDYPDGVRKVDLRFTNERFTISFQDHLMLEPVLKKFLLILQKVGDIETNPEWTKERKRLEFTKSALERILLSESITDHVDELLKQVGAYDFDNSCLPLSDMTHFWVVEKEGSDIATVGAKFVSEEWGRSQLEANIPWPPSAPARERISALSAYLDAKEELAATENIAERKRAEEAVRAGTIGRLADAKEEVKPAQTNRQTLADFVDRLPND